MVTGIYGKMKKERHTDTTSISETHWTGQGKVQLAKSTLEEIMTTNSTTGTGADILMSRRAARALIEWNTIINE